MAEEGPTERRLSLVETDWRAALEAAPGVFAVCDARGIQVANRALLTFLGADAPSDLHAVPIASHFAPEDGPRVVAAIAAVLATRQASGLHVARLATGAAQLAFSLGYGTFEGAPAAVLIGRDVLELQRANEEARRSDALYRRLADNTEDVVAVCDDSLHVVYASPSCERVLGIAPAQLVGRAWRDVQREVLGPGADEYLKKLTPIWNGSMPTLHGAVVLRGSDGREVPIEAEARRVAGPNGRAEYVFVGRDVTAQHAAAKAQRESERRFRQLAQTVPVVVLRTDAEGRCTYMNQRWRDLTGQVPEDAHGFGYFHALEPSERDLLRKAFAGAVRDRAGILLTLRFTAARGEARWGRLESAPEQGPGGEIVGWVGSITDVTDLKSAEAALAAEQARTRDALEAAQAARWEYDLASDRLEWSPDAERVLGIPAGALPHDRASAVAAWHAGDRSQLEQRVAAVASEGDFRGELRASSGGEAPIWLSARGRLERDASGTPVRVVGITQNVSARKRAEAEHAALEEALRNAQRLESLGLLAGGVAHDFNNLLTGILGNAELALETVPPESRPARLLTDLRDAALRAADLTHQILTFTGNRPLERAPVDLGALAAETVRLMAAGLPPRAKIALDARGGVVVEGDATQLRQVVLNLIANARDALPEAGGNIAVRVRAERERAELVVEDDGRGMSAETRDRMFDPFFTTHELGRGLGLAVVHGSVRAHGGEIAVESELGAGTRVVVELPLSQRAVAAPPPEARAKLGTGRGRVLIVDDEPSVARVAAHVLGSAGFEAQVVHDGAAAIASLEAARGELALVLLDLTLRGESGAALLPKIRACAPGVPVVLMSGYATQDVRARLAPNEVAGVLAKPFRATELLGQVEAALASAARGA